MLACLFWPLGSLGTRAVRVFGALVLANGFTKEAAEHLDSADEHFLLERLHNLDRLLLGDAARPLTLAGLRRLGSSSFAIMGLTDGTVLGVVDLLRLAIKFARTPDADLAWSGKPKAESEQMLFWLLRTAQWHSLLRSGYAEPLFGLLASMHLRLLRKPGLTREGDNHSFLSEAQSVVYCRRLWQWQTVGHELPWAFHVSFLEGTGPRTGTYQLDSWSALTEADQLLRVAALLALATWELAKPGRKGQPVPQLVHSAQQAFVALYPASQVTLLHCCAPWPLLLYSLARHFRPADGRPRSPRGRRSTADWSRRLRRALLRSRARRLRRELSHRRRTILDSSARLYKGLPRKLWKRLWLDERSLRTDRCPGNLESQWWLERLLYVVGRMLWRYRIFWWASHGTLLGAVRQRGLIGHDCDVDLDVCAGAASLLVRTDFRRNLLRHGMAIAGFDPVHQKFRVAPVDRRIEHLDIFLMSCEHSSDPYLSYASSASFHEGFKVKYLPHPFWKLRRFGSWHVVVPPNFDEYLDKMYGRDWNTSVRRSCRMNSPECRGGQFREIRPEERRPRLLKVSPRGRFELGWFEY
mmetsp:Transcript_70359/g.205775  ORF Transcript_70359/g.205775 Transcript_70359/m.205775 type:complete len:581 (+) Transcript_70359:68-1810(+)